MENQTPLRGPKCERLGPGRCNVRAHVMHRRGPTRAQPIRTTMAHDGEAHVLWLFCENGPNLPKNRPRTHGTIPTVSYFIDKPSRQSIVATAIPLGTRAHTGTVALAQGGHAGQTSPSPPPIASRYLPRREREALGEETAVMFV